MWFDLSILTSFGSFEVASAVQHDFDRGNGPSATRFQAYETAKVHPKMLT